MENSAVQDTTNEFISSIIGIVVCKMVEEVMFGIELEASLCFGMPKVIAQIKEWE